MNCTCSQDDAVTSQHTARGLQQVATHESGEPPPPVSEPHTTTSSGHATREVNANTACRLPAACTAVARRANAICSLQFQKEAKKKKKPTQPSSHVRIKLGIAERGLPVCVMLPPSEGRRSTAGGDHSHPQVTEQLACCVVLSSTKSATMKTMSLRWRPALVSRSLWTLLVYRGESCVCVSVVD